MYQLSDYKAVQIRWVHIYLTLIKKLAIGGHKKSLDEICIENLISASNNLEIKKEALILNENLRGQKELQKDDIEFLNKFKNYEFELNKEISIITSNDRFESAIDHEFVDELCNDKDLVLIKVDQALSLINNISTKWKFKIEEAIQTIAGLEDDFNVINSGFTKDFPGFISLNINADCSIVGEQIAHESTHLLFDNQVYFNSNFREEIRKIPPVYSVFAKKPRSVELVLHGLFSYTSVYLFWDNLDKLDPDERSRSIKRKSQVLIYIESAVKSLNNVLTNSQWIKILNIYKTICPIFKTNLWNIQSEKKVITEKTLNNLEMSLNNIECAELLLALEGNKVSRISKPISQIPKIINVIDSLPVFYCFSNYVFNSDEDESINSFHNTISNTYNLNNLDSYLNYDLNIHIYFSHNQKDLLSAFFLDKKDKCAPLFKTPKCCENYFNKNWNSAVKKYGGDMTKYYFRNIKKGEIIRELKYNPVPMYFGLGLCWHFPCNLDCIQTKKIIDERIEILAKYPKFLKKIEVSNYYELLIDQNLNYKLKKNKCS